MRAKPCTGSSPHARGTQLAALDLGAVARFIPACAGNANRACTGQTGATVHPRMRGERSKMMQSHSPSLGSSPHARGTLFGEFGFHFLYRFIPACAGNAAMKLIEAFPLPVHPRMRGERSTVGSAGFSPGGSSPHARGTLSDNEKNRVIRRFIPACAGNAAYPHR